MQSVATIETVASARGFTINDILEERVLELACRRAVISVVRTSPTRVRALVSFLGASDYVAEPFDVQAAARAVARAFVSKYGDVRTDGVCGVGWFATA